VLVSCKHNYDNTSELKEEYKKISNQKCDTLVVRFMSCTECLDLYIDSRKLTIPNKFKSYPISEFTDLNICGNFPKDLIDMTSLNYNPELKFTIIGKVIKLDSSNGIGLVPIFYVEKWKKEEYKKIESTEAEIIYVDTNDTL
jgi:hypothetical protein